MSTETLVDEVVEEARKIDAILAELVQEKGEGYVYLTDPDAAGSRKVARSSCYYATYDEDHRPTGPSCIAGHVFFRLGAAAADLAAAEGVDAHEVGKGWIESDQVRSALRRAQDWQDGGYAWARAHAAYRTHLTENGVKL